MTEVSGNGEESVDVEAEDPACSQGDLSAPAVASADVVAGLHRIEAALVDFHHRAAAREAVIDRLHKEKQDLEAGERRTALDPVVTDLIRLHDGLSAVAAAGVAVGAPPLAPYVTEVELILERCGFDRYDAEVGDAYEPGRHRPVRVVATTDPTLDNTVASVVAAGFVDRDLGRVRRPALAVFHRFESSTDDKCDRPDEQTETAQ